MEFWRGTTGSEGRDQFSYAYGAVVALGSCFPVPALASAKNHCTVSGTISCVCTKPEPLGGVEVMTTWYFPCGVTVALESRALSTLRPTQDDMKPHEMHRAKRRATAYTLVLLLTEKPRTHSASRVNASSEPIDP